MLSTRLLAKGDNCNSTDEPSLQRLCSSGQPNICIGIWGLGAAGVDHAGIPLSLDTSISSIAQGKSHHPSHQAALGNRYISDTVSRVSNSVHQRLNLSAEQFSAPRIKVQALASRHIYTFSKLEMHLNKIRYKSVLKELGQERNRKSLNYPAWHTWLLARLASIKRN